MTTQRSARRPINPRPENKTGGLIYESLGGRSRGGSFFWIGVLFVGRGLIFALPPLQTDTMADMLDGLLLQADGNDDDDGEGSVDDDSDWEVVEIDKMGLNLWMDRSRGLCCASACLPTQDQNTPE